MNGIVLMELNLIDLVSDVLATALRSCLIVGVYLQFLVTCLIHNVVLSARATPDHDFLRLVEHLPSTAAQQPCRARRPTSLQTLVDASQLGNMLLRLPPCLSPAGRLLRLSGVRCGPNSKHLG